MVTEDAGVHQHGARGGLVEPRHVKLGFGFARPEERPLAVHPHLDPSVVVVGMRPARRVDLTRGNTHGAHGGHREGRLLAATPLGGTHHGQRRRSAAVGGGIGGLLVAPVVHLQRGVVQRHARDTAAERIVIDHAELVQPLVVNPHGQHEVTEQLLGDVAPPRHLATGAKRHAHVVEKKFAVVIARVGRAHGSVKELHRLALLGRQFAVEDGKQIAVGEHGPTSLEFVVYLATQIAVRDEVARAADRKRGRRDADRVK